MNDILMVFICIVLIYTFGEMAFASKGTVEQRIGGLVPLNYTVYDGEEEE